MSPAVVTKVQEKAERVAQQLELSGLASLQGFVNADTGDLKVIDIDTAPPLHAGSPIYRQVSLHVLQNVRIVALSTLLVSILLPAKKSHTAVLQAQRHLLGHDLTSHLCIELLF